MTTPTPDKLAIPEAAVEAMCDVASRVWGLPIGRQEALDLIASIIPHMPDRGYAEVAPTHRHKKRGSEYVLLGFGKMQAGEWARRVPGRTSILRLVPVDMHEVAIYRSVDDGTLWVRPREEFEDGRFEALIAPPAPADNGEPATHDEESILDVISGNLRMESWVAGKTLTVMFDAESGERRFAKLRLTKIAAQPSPADLKGEPE